MTFISHLLTHTPCAFRMDGSRCLSEESPDNKRLLNHRRDAVEYRGMKPEILMDGVQAASTALRNREKQTAGDKPRPLLPLLLR